MSQNTPSSPGPPAAETPVGRVPGRLVPVLAAVLLLAFGLRVYHLGTRSIWYDEGFTLAVAREVPASLSVFNTALYDEPPMMGAVAALGERAADLAGLTRGFWPYDACVKLAQALFSLGAVFFGWAAFRRLFRDETAALLGALLCAASPYQVYYAQELRAYAPYVFFSSALLYCAVRAVEENRARWWAGVSATMVVLLYTHFFSVWNIALFNVFFVGLIALRRRDLFLPWIVSQGCAFVLVLPALSQMHHANAVYMSVRNIYNIRPNALHGLITFKTFLAGYTGRTAVYGPLFVLGMLLFLAGLWRLRARPRALALALLLAVGPVCANVIVWRLRTFPMYEHRLFVFSGLMVCGAAGLGLASLRPAAVRWAATAILLALMAPCLSDYYGQRLHPAMDYRMGVRYKVDSRAAAQYIALHAKAGDTVGHASHFTYLPMRYYLERHPLPQRCLRLTESELTGFLDTLPNKTLWDNFGVTPRMLPEVAAEGPRMWYVESWWEPSEIPPHVRDMRRWLEGHGRAVDRQQFDGVTVTLFELSHGTGTP